MEKGWFVGEGERNLDEREGCQPSQTAKANASAALHRDANAIRRYVSPRARALRFSALRVAGALAARRLFSPVFPSPRVARPGRGHAHSRRASRAAASHRLTGGFPSRGRGAGVRENREGEGEGEARRDAPRIGWVRP